MVDIETAPHRVYAWGLWDQDIHTSQIVEPGYTLCWAAKWKGDKSVRWESIRDPGPRRFIRNVWALLDAADIVVHYNGTCFDIPILNQEFLKLGLNPPAPYLQVDLLTTARRRFRLASNKMDYVAQHLGLEGKVKHKGMDLWRGCMENDAASWGEMRTYNIRDVELLEEIYDALLPWIVRHPNLALWLDDARPACPKCGSRHMKKQGTTKTMTMIYQRYQCFDCGAWMRDRNNATPRERRKAIKTPIE